MFLISNVDSVQSLPKFNGVFPQKYKNLKMHKVPQKTTNKESWTLKNWCFWTMALERPLRVPWTVRRSNQSILKKISSKYSLEELMLKLQYFGHLMWRSDSLEKTLMLGKTEARRRRGQQKIRWLEMASPTQWTWVWVNSRS